MVLALLVVAGCSEPEEDPSPAPYLESSFDRELARARQNVDTSEAQLEALQRAAETGEMSYEDMNMLLGDLFKCFESAGVEYRSEEDYEVVPGFLVPQYSVRDEGYAAAVSCERIHIEYAFSAFQTQPAVLELGDRALEADRSHVLACLRGNGVAIDDEATLDELRLAAHDLFGEMVDQGVEPVMCTNWL